MVYFRDMPIPFFELNHYDFYFGKPSHLAGYSKELRAYLAVGDTVRVKEGAEDEQSFIGRIAEVRAGCPSYDDYVHRKCNRKLPCFYIQLHITSNDIEDIQDEIPLPSDELSKSAFGMEEAMPTNRFVWISVDQVESIVFLIHEADVIEQTFGSIAGRVNSYFIRFQAMYTYKGNEGSYDLTQIIREDYKTFGPTSGTECGVESYTERMLFSLKHECENSTAMLFRKGKMTSRNKSVKAAKSKEAWNYFVKSVDPDIHTTTKKRKCKRELPHTDLSLSSILYDAEVETVIAQSPADFDSFRDIFSVMFGVGVRKRFPSKAVLNDRSRNPIKLATHDTINVVDIEPEHGVQLDDDVDENRFVGGHSNFIRFQWNSVSRICTTTVRCIPLVVSSHSDAIKSFLGKFRIDLERKEYDGLWVDATVWSNEESKQYKITKIDASNETVEITEVDDEGDDIDDTTKQITFDECKNNYPMI